MICGDRIGGPCVELQLGDEGGGVADAYLRFVFKMDLISCLRFLRGGSSAVGCGAEGAAFAAMT